MKQTKLWVRVLAIVLALLIVGGAIASVVVSMAEEAPLPRDRYELTMVWLENEQALQVTQRLVYHNATNAPMDRVVFSAAANCYRRESALNYENDVLYTVFPEGYAPGGIALDRVLVNGETVDYGFMDANECILRVSCEIAPGKSCEFQFDYVLLLTRNCSLLGAYDTDVRLSGFCFQPGLPVNGDFIVNTPISFTRYTETTPADYEASIVLPDNYAAVGTGVFTSETQEGHTVLWRFTAENARDFALSFSKRWRTFERATEHGVSIRAYTNVRNVSAYALDTAEAALSLYDEWLGLFPCTQISLVQSDYPVCAVDFPGVVWIPEAHWLNREELKRDIRFALAQQYIGYRAWTEPVSDAWLSDVPCTYLTLMVTEELEGYDAFLKELNDIVLDSIRITLPGGLYVTMSANLMTREEYELITLGRGTVVMHETRVAMGRDQWILAMREFYQMGLKQQTLTELDFAEAFHRATGGDWEDFLTEWLFNVDDYIEQQVEWYE